MKIIKRIMIGLSTTFLVSCNSLKPQVVSDISFGEISRCRIRCYDPIKLKKTKDYKCDIYSRKDFFNYRGFYHKEWDDDSGKWALRFTSGNYPLKYCDGLMGFFADDFAVKIKPEIRKAIKECEK